MKAARSLLLLMSALLADRATAQGAEADTLLPKVIAFLERTLDDLRQVGTNARSFTMAFTDEAARHPCDVCPDRDRPMDPHRYAFQVEEAFPDAFPFTHSIDHDRITTRKLDRTEFEWRVPFTKKIPASTNPTAAHLSRPFIAHQVAVVKYVHGAFSIRNVEAVTAPAAHLMLELFALKGIGTSAFDGPPGFTPEVASTIVGAGASWYFNPFTPRNSGNIWLKAGIRLSQRTDDLAATELGYEQANTIHTQATGAGGFVVDAYPTIDVRQRAYDIRETVRSTTITVPLGISKRFSLSTGMDLALELEASYNLALSRSISGSYQLDQTGTNHTINGEVMETSGGGTLAYTAANAAVVDAATGDRIDFFTGRTSALQDLDAGDSGTLGFAFLPALLIKKNNAVKYAIGMRLQWMGNPRATGTSLDRDWFLDDTDTARPTLNSLTSDGFRLFAGLTFGTTL